MIINLNTPLHLLRFLGEMNENTPIEAIDEISDVEMSPEDIEAQKDAMWNEHDSDADIFDDMTSDDFYDEEPSYKEDDEIRDPRMDKIRDFRNSRNHKRNRWWKKRFHGAMRSAVRGGNFDVLERDVSDPWTSSKDSIVR